MNKKKTRSVNMTATEQEWNFIEEAHVASGLPLATWLRLIALRAADKSVGPGSLPSSPLHAPVYLQNEGPTNGR